MPILMPLVASTLGSAPYELDDAQGEAAVAAKPLLGAKTPPLHPVVLAPLNWSRDSAAREFLASLDRLEVAAVRGPSGQVQFTIDVFELHCAAATRIPTRRSALRSQLAGQARAPDRRVTRSFASFATLREAALEHVCANAMFVCAKCRAFEQLARFGLHQPRAVARLATSVDQRRRLLQRFLDDLVARARSRRSHARDCKLRDKLPLLLERFLTEEGDEGDIEVERW